MSVTKIQSVKIFDHEMLLSNVFNYTDYLVKSHVAGFVMLKNISIIILNEIYKNTFLQVCILKNKPLESKKKFTIRIR